MLGQTWPGARLRNGRVRVLTLLRRSPGALGQALPVAAGLAVQAVTTYVTLVLAGRILGAAEFGGLAALYVLVSSVATGLFQPLEQEVARRRGRERETGRAERTLLRRAFLFGICLCVLIVGASLVVRGATVRLLGDEPQLLAAFCVSLPGYALCFVIRGGLSGSRRLARYGLQLSVEGAFRLIGLACLAVLEVHSVPAYGWLFGLAPWVALAFSIAGLRPAPTSSKRSGDRDVHPLVAPLILLLASSLAAQLLIGAGPVTAQLFAGADDKARTGAFLAALLVVRLPVFLFTAVQPSMLPAMAAHAAADRKSAFLSLLAKVFASMGLLALLTTVVTAAIGPWALMLMFGADYVLSWSVFLLLGVSVGLFLASAVLGQAVLALGEHHSVTIGWLTGLFGLALGTALVEDAILKATIGLLVGAAAAAATFTLLLWRPLRRWCPANAEGTNRDVLPVPPAAVVLAQPRPRSPEAPPR
jgi:O-antigen/teichoic acid export membrane protein